MIGPLPGKELSTYSLAKKHLAVFEMHQKAAELVIRAGRPAPPVRLFAAQYAEIDGFVRKINGNAFGLADMTWRGAKVLKQESGR